MQVLLESSGRGLTTFFPPTYLAGVPCCSPLSLPVSYILSCTSAWAPVGFGEATNEEGWVKDRYFRMSGKDWWWRGRTDHRRTGWRRTGEEGFLLWLAMYGDSSLEPRFFCPESREAVFGVGKIQVPYPQSQAEQVTCNSLRAVLQTSTPSWAGSILPWDVKEQQTQAFLKEEGPSGSPQWGGYHYVPHGTKRRNRERPGKYLHVWSCWKATKRTQLIANF